MMAGRKKKNPNSVNKGKGRNLSSGEVTN